MHKRLSQVQVTTTLTRNRGRGRGAGGPPAERLMQVAAPVARGDSCNEVRQKNGSNRPAVALIVIFVSLGQKHGHTIDWDVESSDSGAR